MAIEQMSWDIKLYREDAYFADITMIDPTTNIPVNFNLFTIKSDVRFANRDLWFQIPFEIIDAEQGKVRISLSTPTVRSLYDNFKLHDGIFDIQLTQIESGDSVTPIKGTVKIINDVTKNDQYNGTQHQGTATRL